MARSRSTASVPFAQRLRRHLRAYNWRRVAYLAGGSLVFSVALVGYLFGVSDHFIGRLFSAFLVVFWLLAVTFLVAVPFVGWAAANWFGRSWAEAPQPVPRTRKVSPAPPAVPRPRANVAVRTPASESYQ